MSRVGLVVLACLVGAAASAPPPVVSVAPTDTVRVRPGATRETEVRITVAEGFHVQANPAANEFLIPLTLEIETPDGLEVTDIVYPPSQRFRLKGADEDLLVYDDTLTVTVSIRAPAGAQEGERTARGRLRYQACNDRMCLPPTTHSFNLKVRVQKGQPRK